MDILTNILKEQRHCAIDLGGQLTVHFVFQNKNLKAYKYIICKLIK